MRYWKKDILSCYLAYARYKCVADIAYARKRMPIVLAATSKQCFTHQGSNLYSYAHGISIPCVPFKQPIIFLFLFSFCLDLYYLLSFRWPSSIKYLTSSSPNSRHVMEGPYDQTIGFDFDRSSTLPAKHYFFPLTVLYSGVITVSYSYNRITHCTLLL